MVLCSASLVISSSINCGKRDICFTIFCSLLTQRALKSVWSPQSGFDLPTHLGGKRSDQSKVSAISISKY